MNKQEITVREVRQEDSSAIVAILRSLDWSEQFQNETPAQTETYVAARIEQCRREPNNTILVAERRREDGNCQIVGYVAVHWFPHLVRGCDGYVSELFINASETGHGVGSLLLDRVNTYAHERNCAQLILMNRRIRESYRRSFYAKRGWVEQADGAFFSLVLPAAHS